VSLAFYRLFYYDFSAGWSCYTRLEDLVLSDMLAEVMFAPSLWINPPLLKPDLQFVVLACSAKCSLRLGCVVTSAKIKSEKKFLMFMVRVICNPALHLHIKPYSVPSAH